MAKSMAAIEREPVSSDNSLIDSGSESGASERSLNGARIFPLPSMDYENHHVEKPNGHGRTFHDHYNERFRYVRGL